MKFMGIDYASKEAEKNGELSTITLVEIRKGIVKILFCTVGTGERISKLERLLKIKYAIDNSNVCKERPFEGL